MIVQIAQFRNELHLIKEMLPIWKRYADGFVFLLDTNTDGTEEYLKEVKDVYNILDVLTYTETPDVLKMETDVRQQVFDTARSYSNKIICLDADEYLDGSMTKEELSNLLDSNLDTVYHLRWVQYISCNSIRTDGPWANNYKDRIGSYQKPCLFESKQMHSTHLPFPEKQQAIDPTKLFIAHLQWLDKTHVGIKQYFWKVTDYVNHTVHGAQVVDKSAYDASINNFEWEEEYFDYPLQIRDDIFEDVTNSGNYRLDYIKEQTLKHSIPNLGDWNLNIHNSIPMYFCTISDDKHYPLLVNMIGSIYRYNYYDVESILVYDLGLSETHKRELSNMKKVVLCEIEQTNPDIISDIRTSETRYVKGLFSWKPVVLKDALDKYPYVLYLDAGTTIMKPLNGVFKHIKQNGYLFFDCGHSIKWMTTKYLIDKLELESDANKFILHDATLGIDAGFQGVSRDIYDSYILPMYEYSKDILNFTDDGTCPDGWGTGRHDQTLFSILVRKLGYNVELHDSDSIDCNLSYDGKIEKIHMCHAQDKVNSNTLIFRSRWNFDYNTFKLHSASIRRKYRLSVITGIGPSNKYKKFIPTYFSNIQEQVNFKSIEFVIVYSEWDSLFDDYAKFDNIFFIKEDDQLGVYNAWNIGIRNATTEYVTNWNVDDIRFNINTAIKYDCLVKNTDVDLVYNYYTPTTEDGLDKLDVSNLPYTPYPDNFHECVLSMCMAGPDPLWRKSAHTFIGYFDFKNYSIIGDWEMWIRMAANGMRFKLLPYVLCIYVDHNDTVSRSNNTNLEQQKEKLLKQFQN
jgi:hypothetical protein